MEKRRENNAARQKKAVREKKRREGRRASEGGKGKDTRPPSRRIFSRASPFFLRAAFFSRAAFSSRSRNYLHYNELNEIILKRRLGTRQCLMCLFE